MQISERNALVELKAVLTQKPGRSDAQICCGDAAALRQEIVAGHNITSLLATDTFLFLH